MLRKLFLLIVAAVVVICIVAWLRPDEFKVSRSGAITASPEIVFEQVNDLHKWQNWSPWAKLDPHAKITFEGPEAGVGAAFSWAGNSEVGKGKMTILESRASEYIKFKLEFDEPFAGTNSAEFTFTPQANETIVTWTMTGKSPFIAKVVGLFLNCDKMVGDQFEAGLNNLRAVSTAAVQ